MLTVWRLLTARYSASAFTGEGARLYGGRWNKKGVPLVYTADCQALALLEMLAQDEPLHTRYVMICATIPSNLKIQRITTANLPADWREMGAREELRNLGSEWVRLKTSAVLAVPSVLIPDQTNYLLNPRHPEFAKIEIGKPKEFVTDLRLIRQ
ncbi:MAG: RES family NAD+ phosphorylase [Burkholderiales bacterium]